MESRSFEERFHLSRPGLQATIGRDLRLLALLGGMMWKNLTIGRRVRRRYIACREAGEPFWIDAPTSADQDGLHK